MTTPLQKLEAIPKVWLVWYYSDLSSLDDDSFVDSIHRTEDSARVYIHRQPIHRRKHYTLEWMELLD